MKPSDQMEDVKADEAYGSKSINMKRKKKNIKRLGGGGLSLEAFANAKSTNSNYNPALIKKRREFCKNAKYVKKYKKSLEQRNGGENQSSIQTPLKDDSGTENVRKTDDGKDKKSKRKKSNLEEIFRKKREEEEKVRMEREAIIRAKKEQKEKSEARRKAEKERMLKKTRHGQPVMKYRIEHLLESIQNSAGKVGGKNG